MQVQEDGEDDRGASSSLLWRSDPALLWRRCNNGHSTARSGANSAGPLSLRARHEIGDDDDDYSGQKRRSIKHNVSDL